MNFPFLRLVCVILSAVAILAGVIVGLALTYLGAFGWDSYATMAVGANGPIAGAVLVGAGLISLAILAGPPRVGGGGDDFRR